MIKRWRSIFTSLWRRASQVASNVPSPEEPSLTGDSDVKVSPGVALDNEGNVIEPNGRPRESRTAVRR
jgi:hypothetical protein